MSDPRRYRFGPLERRTVAGPLSAGQVVIAASAALSALLAAYGLRNTLGLAAAIAILSAGALALLLPFEGRTAEQWAPVLLRWGFRAWRKETTYRSASPGTGIRVCGNENPRPAPSLPSELTGLDMLEVPYRQADVGVIRDRRDGTYTTAMVLRGGAFGLCEPGEQERKLDGWGAVLASTARDSSPVRRLQWVERTLPADGDELTGYLQAEREEAIPLASQTVRSYIDLVESAGPATQDHEILLVVQVDQGRAARDIRRLGGGDEGATRVLLREAEALAERLSIADITVYGLLRARKYARVIRDGFDPYGRRSRSRLAILDRDREGTDPALMGPIAAQESWSTYHTDSALHTTYWISAWPRSEVGAAFLTPLLMQAAVVRTVSVTVEPVPFGVAVRKAEAAQTSEEADEIQRHRQGFSTTARTRRRQEAVARREEEISHGHAEMRFAGFLTISGETVEQLEENCSEAEHAAQLSRLELQRLYGEQAAGLTFALPLARGLR